MPSSTRYPTGAGKNSQRFDCSLDSERCAKGQFVFRGSDHEKNFILHCAPTHRSPYERLYSEHRTFRITKNAHSSSNHAYHDPANPNIETYCAAFTAGH